MGPFPTGRRFATLVRGVGIALACCSGAVAQRLPARTVPAPIDFATSQDDNLFSLLRSQDHIHAFEEARRELEAGEHAAAVERLHRLLQIDEGGVVPVGPGRFVGLRLAAVIQLANLAPAAAAAYAALVQREAGNLAGDPTQQTEAQLQLLADRFPAAPQGQRARLRLGDLALDRGQGLAAAIHYRAALDAATIGSSDERRINTRRHLAAVLVDPATARADARAQRLPASGDDVLGLLPSARLDGLHAAYGGGASGRTPMATPVGNPTPRCSEEIHAPDFVRREIGQFAMQPVGDLDGIHVNTGREVVTFDPLRGRVRWVSRAPLQEHVDYSDSTNHDFVLAPAVQGDVVVAALQVPEKSANVDFNGGIRIMFKLPQRRLFAFSRSTGKELWAHFDDLDGPRTRKFRGHDACSAPLIAGDTVYAPVHDRSGAIAFAVAAYDLHTGQQKWRQLVCSSQQDVNMFGNARTEFASSPLCLHDGVLFGASNLGVAFAVDAATGRIRWITAYDVVVMPRAMLHAQAERQVFFANNAPVVAEDVVCLTPLDSQFVLGLDTEAGAPIWRLPAEATVGRTDNRVFWLAGAIDDEFVLAGTGVVAVRARPEQQLGEQAEVRQMVRPEQLTERRDRNLPARPALSDGHLWLPRHDRVLCFDRAGNPALQNPRLELPRYQPGNLLLTNGLIVSLRQRSLDVLYDGQAMLQAVAASAERSPDDPAGILRLASLQAALLGDEPSAQSQQIVLGLYRRGLEACQRRGLPKSHPVRQALQRELFAQAHAAARSAVQRGADTAMAQLVAARDVAPDAARWVEVQALVLLVCADDPAARATELQRLLDEAADATFPFGDGMPVRTYVAWQRAQAQTTAELAVPAWQQLLELHGDERLGNETVAGIAAAAIEQWLQRAGPAAYAPIAAKAEAELRRAGDDATALEGVGRRYPNSAAAEQARLRLLDLAVARGDLAIAASVLARGNRLGTAAPGIVRRVLAAATARGNHALAQAMAGLLARHGDTPSDWGADAGKSYREVLAQLPPPPPANSPSLDLPAVEVGRLQPTSPREFLRLLPAIAVAGFVAPVDPPVYVVAGSELRALDPAARGASRELWSASVDFLEQVMLCGTTLVVPDMARTFAVDYRSGELRWELPNPEGRLIDQLGLQSGVLQLSLQPSSAQGLAEHIGIEPLTGTVLFRRQLGEAQLKPKAVPEGLLGMTTAADGAATIEWIEPTTGTIRATLSLASEQVRQHLQLPADSVATRLYPQWLCTDGDQVFLPIDGALSGDTPRLLSLDREGRIGWHWQGSRGSELQLAATLPGRVVLVEGSEGSSGRCVVLASSDGAVQQEVRIGYDVRVLNWERSWLANPAPDHLAIESFADAGRTERQLVVVPLRGAGDPFVVPLANEEGDLMRTPLFGADFLTFVTRPRRNASVARLYAIDLGDRSGRWPEGRRYQRLDAPGACDGVANFGRYTVVSGAQGLLLLGATKDPR